MVQLEFEFEFEFEFMKVSRGDAGVQCLFDFICSFYLPVDDGL